MMTLAALANGTCHEMTLSRAAAASSRVGRLLCAGRAWKPVYFRLEGRFSRRSSYFSSQDSGNEGASLISPDNHGVEEPHIAVLMEEVLSSFRDKKLGVGTSRRHKSPLQSSTLRQRTQSQLCHYPLLSCCVFDLSLLALALLPLKTAIMCWRLGLS